MPTETLPSNLATGARVLIRDAEWLVRKVDRTSTGDHAIEVVGLSEIVRDREAIFLTSLEDRVEVLDPAETELVADTSPNYRNTLLHLEAQFRQIPPTDASICLGNRAAIDLVPYQLDPALQALRQPRQRILIADGVGLGKTIECGILLSELIRRGKARRILVLAVKSMLTQFQKELWTRFAIPLVRLDSVGLQRVRQRIPTGHNPFYHFDRTIISIDTLKQDTEYRTYLEQCRWDVIVIDEAHNVAERGTGSQRARLARLLASRSDTLILLSATPHDGRARSFASLMNMLNPTAIADPDNYGPEDIDGLFIRRFKKDIKDQVGAAFKERVIRKDSFAASLAEEAAFALLGDAEFVAFDRQRSAGALFRTVLEKALFSSPAACRETIRNRLHRLAAGSPATAPASAGPDITHLQALDAALALIGPDAFSRYQRLLHVICDRHDGFGWTGADPADRIVIFTERLESLKFLYDHLRPDIGLKDDQVGVLDGSMPDVDQQKVVEQFGLETSPLRLLLASDVASEGINLHYQSHRLIHFDIPWSLMVFQQRNGRIDRYGQTRQPQIVYLVTESSHPRVRGDMRILELLIAKDDEVTRNIGDPSEFMRKYDVEEEERATAAAIERGLSPESFEKQFEDLGPDPLQILLGATPPPRGETAAASIRPLPSLFPDDYAFARAAAEFVRDRDGLQFRTEDEGQFLQLTAPSDLWHRASATLPHEVLTDSREFVLTADRARVMEEMRRCIREEQHWPAIQLLWELHPVVEWLQDKLLGAFGRQQAPVVSLPGPLRPGEAIFLISGIIPNLKSQPAIAQWVGVHFRATTLYAVHDLDAILRLTRLGSQSYPNRGARFDLAPLRAVLPAALDHARANLSAARTAFEADYRPKLEAQIAKLDRLRRRQIDQLELDFGDNNARGGLAQVRAARRERRRREIDRLFDEYREWIRDTMVTEDKPYLRLAAVFTG